MTTLTPIALLLALAGCAAQTGPVGAPNVVELSTKADAALGLDLGALDLFGFDPCRLDGCRYRIAFEDLEPGSTVHLAAAGIHILTAYRRDLLAGQAPAADYVTTTSAIATEDGEAVLFIEAELRDSLYGLAYVEGKLDGTGPVVDATLRLVPDLDAATPLPIDDEGSFAVTSYLDEGQVHRWTVPISDFLDLGDPEAFIVVGFAPRVRQEVYYQCTSDGATEEVWQIRGDAPFIPDCATWDESGSLYFEMGGRGGYGIHVRLSE